ncbi:DUF799 domain-containing protein [Teredinibacter turnerae]|uniref:DUF799 domain-containing protein n=1 Tax=Teredinibacter turnerae TaxID=2426 RepID=UPI000414329D|nr:GNA1162 family protein [Teredinibacter turnerae]
MNKFIVLMCLAATMLLSGCDTAPQQENSLIYTYAPRSILVIPPMNNSVEVNASYTFMSTLSRPLAEKGYYVFPVAVIDNFLKENGLPTPAEMNGIALDKIQQHIGADAVLYVSIDEWGQKFQLVSSVTIVRATLTMVDTATGTEIWKARVSGSDSNSNSNQQGGGIAGAILSAVVSQIANSLQDNTYELSRQATNRTVAADLPKGPYRLEAEAAMGAK